MGNHKVKWTSEEEGALKAGVAKHGTGRWKNILRDPEFARFLTNRSNIDLKVSRFFFLFDVYSFVCVCCILLLLFWVDLTQNLYLKVEIQD